MASVSAIRDGLRTRLATISGLRVPHRPPGEVTTPAAIVAGPAISYDSTMSRGSDDFTFTVSLLMSRGWDRAAEQQLDGYLAGSGSSSVKQVLEADPAGLGVSGVDYVHVVSTTEPGSIEVGAISYFGVQITVEVAADGTV
jgi:hypothetical protein